MIFTRAALVPLLTLAPVLANEVSAPAPPARSRAAERLGITFTPPSAPAAAPGTSLSPGTTPPGDLSSLVILPKLDVRADRIDLQEQEVLTGKGQLDYAKKRHLTPLYRKTFGPLSLVATVALDPLKILGGVRANDAEATALYDEEERIRRKRETEDLIDLVEELDPEMSRELRRTTETSNRLPTPMGERRHE